MKYIVLILLLALLLQAQERKRRLWIDFEETQHDNDFYLVQDLDTNTRCYAVTNHSINASGYAISCVKQ